jgi:hypothetical protein
MDFNESETKKLPLPQFSFYIAVASTDDGRNCQSKHVVYVRKILLLWHLWCCIGRVTIEGINLSETKSRLFYLKIQSVPRCKHFFVSVIKTSLRCVGQKSLFVLR